MITLIFDNPDKTKTYTIRYNLSCQIPIWICTEEGEGMAIKMEDIYKMIDKWYQENF
jgi:hypothetical protein